MRVTDEEEKEISNKIRILIEKGYSYKKISEMLNISLGTVRAHGPIRSKILGNIYGDEIHYEHPLPTPHLIQEPIVRKNRELKIKKVAFKYFSYLVDNVDNNDIDVSAYKDNVYVKILSYLYKVNNKQVTSKKISKNIKLNKSHLSIELRQLTNAGYVCYSSDRRLNTYAITDKGKELYEKISQKLKKLQAL